MATLKQKQLTFLNETIAHYTSANRALNSNGKCMYVPVEGKSDGCAIGRHIKSKKLCAILDTKGSIQFGGVFEMLPKKLQTLTKPFLYRVQHLHDTEGCWNDTGLSEFGDKKVNELKVLFEL